MPSEPTSFTEVSVHTPSGSMRYESESEGASLFRGGTMSSVCVYPQVLHSYTVCQVCEVGPFTVIVYL